MAQQSTYFDNDFQVSALSGIPLVKMPSTFSPGDITRFENILQTACLTSPPRIILDFGSMNDIYILSQLERDHLFSYLKHAVDQGIDIIVWSAKQSIIEKLDELNLRSLLLFDSGTEILEDRPYPHSSHSFFWSLVKKYLLTKTPIKRFLSKELTL
jgi:hypothetical protein